MGTRCLTAVVDKNGTEILTMYRQMDGYPDGHGDELREAFGHVKMVNGISDRSAPIANGIGCLAAQVVAHFKDGPGSIYIEPPGTRDCGEEFLYVLKSEGEGRGIHLTVYGGPMTAFGLPSKEGAVTPIWEGSLADFDAAEADAAYEKAMT